MSRHRSQSPRNRRLQWAEPNCDPRSMEAELDGEPKDWNQFREYFREEGGYSGGPRRPPPPERPPFRRPRSSEPPPLPPPQWAERRPGGFRPPHPYSSRSPGRLPRDPPPHRGGEPSRGRGRYREPSPRGAEEEERGRRSTQEPPPPPLHHDRSPPFKRHRPDWDRDRHPGFRDQEARWGRGFSPDAPRGQFGGTAPQRDGWQCEDRGPGAPGGPRRAGSREPPHWEESAGGREAEPHGPGHRRRSQEPFRHKSRERRFRDEEPRAPGPRHTGSSRRFENQGGTHSHRGRGGSHPMRNCYGYHRGGRGGPARSFQEPPQEEHLGGYRPLAEDPPEPPPDTDGWGEPARQRDPKPTWSPQRQPGRNPAGTENPEETLTIKVDMSRPAQLDSALMYSADRQLSLDLVHVGRQRLDFLPLLEHSGTFREPSTHSGTFAQEIITLVHQVKEQYFRGGGLTLDRRFSTAPKRSWDQAKELTLDRRFTSNRGFSLNISSLLDEDDDEEPLLSRLPPVQGLNQPVRGPGDLRHDLERRRQEKLEEVKVTIPGRSGTQGPPPGAREQYGRMQDDRTGPRRGGAHHGPHHGPPARNQGFTTNPRPSFHSGSTGSDW